MDCIKKILYKIYVNLFNYVNSSSISQAAAPSKGLLGKICANLEQTVSSNYDMPRYEEEGQLREYLTHLQ